MLWFDEKSISNVPQFSYLFYAFKTLVECKRIQFTIFVFFREQMKKTIFSKVQKLFYTAIYSESVPDRYSDGYAAMERVGDIIYRCENDDINTGHSISVYH